MADNLPEFEEKENIAGALLYKSVQNDILESFTKQKEQLKEMGMLTNDLQAKVKRRNMGELKDLEAIGKLTSLLETEMLRGVKLTDDAEIRTHRRDVKNIEERIKMTKLHIKQSRELTNFEIAMEMKKYKEGTKWYDFALNRMKEITGFKMEELSLAKKVGDEMLKFEGVTAEVAYTVGEVVMMLKGAFDLFKKMDTAAWKFRETMGMTRTEATFIRKDAESTAISYMSMGVTIEGVYKSYKAIGAIVGGVHNVTKDMARDVSLMAVQLGVAEDVSAGFLRNMAVLSRTSMESQTNMMGLAQSMSAAAGVPLADVMKDVGTHSDKTLTMMSRMPNTVLRTAIELRRMGTSMDQAANSSRHILDFTENMNEEMDASVLLGRSINLQHARELAYKKDLEGSTKEILRLTKSVNFAKLDVFQREAFAKATGKTVDELMNMLQTDKQIRSIKNGTNARAKEELATYEKMRQENEKSAKVRAKDSMVMIRTMANQERMNQLTNKWNEILARAQQFLLPVIDTVLGIALHLMDLGPILMSISKFILPIVEGVGMWLEGGIGVLGIFTKITAPLVRWGGIFGKIATFVLKIGMGISRLLSPFGKIIGFAAKFLGFAAEWLEPIGWVILAFQFIGNIFKRFSNIGFVKGEWLKNIGRGIAAVGMAIYDTLLKPFVDVFKWIWDHLCGHSPSLIGKGIVNGIISIGTILLKVIVAPWKLAFSVIGKLVPMLGKLIWRGIVAYTGMWMSLGKLIWRGITAYFHMWKSIGGAVFSGAKYLGKMIWQGITSYFNFGSIMLKGITSIGKLVFNAILSPYKMAFRWIVDKFAGIGHFIGRLFGKTGTVEQKAQAAYIPVATITPTGTKFEHSTHTPKAGTKEETPPSQVMTEETGLKMVALLEKIHAKNVNISMDGQLLSTTLARQTEFKGGYGVNKVA